MAQLPRLLHLFCAKTNGRTTGWAADAARKIKVALLAIVPHTLNTGIAELEYDVGSVSVKGDANQKLGWDQLLAHKPLVHGPNDSDCPGRADNQLRRAA